MICTLSIMVFSILGQRKRNTWKCGPLATVRYSCLYSMFWLPWWLALFMITIRLRLALICRSSRLPCIGKLRDMKGRLVNLNMMSVLICLSCEYTPSSGPPRSRTTRTSKGLSFTSFSKRDRYAANRFYSARGLAAVSQPIRGGGGAGNANSRYLLRGRRFQLGTRRRRGR